MKNSKCDCWEFNTLLFKALTPSQFLSFHTCFHAFLLHFFLFLFLLLFYLSLSSFLMSLPFFFLSVCLSLTLLLFALCHFSYPSWLCHPPHEEGAVGLVTPQHQDEGLHGWEGREGAGEGEGGGCRCLHATLRQHQCGSMAGIWQGDGHVCLLRKQPTQVRLIKELPQPWGKDTRGKREQEKHEQQ